MFGKALGAARAKSTVAGGGGGGKAALECPVDREELGRGTWDLLHTTAAYYPETPSATDKAAGEGLVLGLTRLRRRGVSGVARCAVRRVWSV